MAFYIKTVDGSGLRTGGGSVLRVLHVRDACSRSSPKRFQVGQVWVAVDRADTAIGYAITNAVDDTLYLHQIDVELSYERRGIGSELIHTVCA